MKKLTIKLRITLWFSIMMILLYAVIFVFITFVSNSTASRDNQGILANLVDNNVEEIDYDDGALEVDDDFIAFRDGVYCLVYYESGEKYIGNTPIQELDELDEVPFENGNVRSVTVEGESYLIYDRLVVFKHHPDVWVRGIVKEYKGAVTSQTVYQAVLITFPILILLAAVGGYFIAKRSLQPIQKICETADVIGKSGDLSKRIEMEGNTDELHQLAAAFNHMFDRLQANFEAERNFTSDASHELRTPVATILAQCEYAFENAKGEEELYESIGAIQKQGYRMSHIIESLLQFTRIEQKTEMASFENLDLSELVKIICREHREEMVRDISLEEQIEPGIKMKADRDMISRLLFNLLQNAVRYGREGGYIKVSLRDNKAEIILSVADNGIGIAEGEMSKIWNRFYRVDQSRSSSNGLGLGLGLAMVRQIAQIHGGRVRVESEPEKGSVFKVTFPR